MKKLSLYITTTLLLFFTLFTPLIASPSFLEDIAFVCNLEESTVTCDLPLSVLPNDYLFSRSDCAKYENNPSYRYAKTVLTRDQKIFCYKPLPIFQVLTYHIYRYLPLLFVTLFLKIIVLTIFFLKDEKRKKIFTTFILANLVSVTLFYLATISLPYTGLLYLLLLLILLTLLEVSLFRILIPKIKIRKILTYSLLANIFFFILGSYLLSFLN